MSDGSVPADQYNQRLGQLINGFMISQAIHVAVTLSVPDFLRDGALSCDRLASLTGAHSPPLYRLLRALAAVGILHETDDRQFSLTPLGNGLATGTEGSLNAWARFVTRPPLWSSWNHLLHSVRTGETGFQHVHRQDVWSFRASNPEESAIFDQAMHQASKHIGRALVAAYDFAGAEHVVDVGGGDGALLAAVLAASPHAVGTLLDLPHVTAGASQALNSAGVLTRCNIIAGSFFENVPRDGDIYVLKHVLHDWQDSEARRILRNCRQAMPLHARLLVIERLLEPANAGAEGKLSDLNMLVNSGGRERTREEFEALMQSAGLEMRMTTVLTANRDLIEAVPKGAPDRAAVSAPS
jgi:hypothetical protein